MGKKVGTQTIQYIQEVGCVQDCSVVIPVNEGMELPCKNYNDMESGLLRVRALEDEQLFASGLVTIVDRSNLDENLRIRSWDLDIGEIRTEDNGARGLSECKYNFEGMTYEQFHKKFYVVNTNKHLEFCPREFRGSKLSDLIGDSTTNYEDFAMTDMADILIAKIIEKYRKDFVAKFVLLSVWESEGKNQHGDDGVLAKAWFAAKNQYFHALEYDLSGIGAGDFLNAIEGGKKYVAEFDAAPDLTTFILNFVLWLNDLKDTNRSIYNVTFDSATSKVIVTSAFATEKVRLRVVINDGSPVDWGAKCTLSDQVAPVLLQNAMLINDVPLLFQYEEINETNFVKLFKKYIKEFSRYLHRNGFSDLSMDDIRIGIDPELMLEREDAIACRFMAGGVPLDFADQIGITEDKFIPLNALSGTGLFFMTIPGNILVMSDPANEGNGLPGTGRVRIKEGCEGLAQVIFDNPIGSGVEAFGAFASNLCGSWFVEDNNLDGREPYENTRGVLMCFDEDCRRDCLNVATCNLSASAQLSAEYDAEADETTFTVQTTVSGNDGYTVEYDLSYSMSDGTSQTGITTGSFTIVVPGDQTDDGVTLNVFGNICAVDGSVEKCCSGITASKQFGSGSGVVYCSHFVENVNVATGTTLALNYTAMGGSPVQTAFVNPALDLNNPADFAAIEAEIEAILPGSIATVSGVANDVTIQIENVISWIQNVEIVSDLGGGGEVTTALEQDCN